MHLRHFVLISVASLLPLLAHAADSLPVALPCGKVGSAGGLGAGDDLVRHTIDTMAFPDALCNDATPAVFYYGAASPADSDKWLIFLQGGGSCGSGQKCAERWCSIDTNFGMDKMTSSLTKPQIRGAGFLSPDAQKNEFATWNRVLLFYCSSDQWAGTKANTLSATNGSVTREFSIQFRGSHIVDAVLDTLRNAGPGGRRRVVRHGVQSHASTTPWPDLDTARVVLFAGSSGGGNGVRNNADRVGEKLRSTNAGLADYRVLVDAIFKPDTSTLDYSKTTFCRGDPSGCSYETFTRDMRESVDQALIAARGDSSCVEFHAAREPGSEWRCSDKDHVLLHHITTPFFMRQDLLDSNIAENFVEAGLGTASDYATGVEATLRNLPLPEEPRGAVPGIFAPQCTDHEGFTSNDVVFETRVNGSTYHDLVWNWAIGAQPQQAIARFNGVVAAAPGCP